MMHVLVTGHEGYVGSHLMEHLLKQNHTVGYFEGDLLDTDWENLDERYDTVIHLAGLAGVRRSFSEPLEYYKNNVELSRRIFKYCERTNTNIMYASSSNAHEWWLNPYATTKQMLEEMASMLTVKHIGMKFHTVWPGRDDMLYKRLIRDDVKYINEDHFRDWIHIEDLLNGLCTIMENCDIIEQSVVDIGTGHITPVKQVAKKFGFTGEWRKGEAPGERMATCADVEYLLALGWTPKHNIMNEG
jgi:nucleoside-diphosphate-sugar epimerase|tara:strand:+ start:2500 stop:3231 length:732 start_codon:yes stop_codon:yes gene_type:complete